MASEERMLPGRSRCAALESVLQQIAYVLGDANADPTTLALHTSMFAENVRAECADRRKESETLTSERDAKAALLHELAAAARWALDLPDLYDERLAGIDSPAQVYSQTHLAGKAKAREVLRHVDAEAGDAR